MLKHIIFDYDGVLVDSFRFHLDKYNDIFDVSLTAQELRDAHNSNFYQNKSAKFNLINIQKYVSTVAADQKYLPLRPGVKESLTILAKNKTLHLVTSGWERQILPNLKHHDIDTLFAHTLFADHGLAKHEKIRRILSDEKVDSALCIFVTDTLGDLLEAREVPIQSVALTIGFHSEETLKKGNPDYMFNTWESLHSFLISI